MSKIHLIGDIHGSYRHYHRQLDHYGKNTVQVGDLGIGFRRPDGSYCPNPHYNKMVEGNHRFIRGNHDNPEICKRHTQYIPDGTFEDNIMYCGGAVSIDKEYRTEGYDWWSDEELKWDEFGSIFEEYKEKKPDVVVSHTAPSSLGDALAWASNRGYKLGIPSDTEAAFEHMLSIHKPKLWVFGHWHVNFDYEYNDTRFICLESGFVRTLNTETLEISEARFV